MITTKQMQQLERLAAKKGIFPAELMENAAKQIHFSIKQKYHTKNSHIIIFAGQGNNGGDGFATAKHFAKENPVVILFFGKKEKLSDAALEHYESIRKNINIIKIENKSDLDQFRPQKNIHCIFIDALLGTGIKDDLKDPISFAIDHYNTLLGTKVSIDIPSGIDPDNEKTFPKSCHADYIITLHDLKPGLEPHKDKTVIVDIGLPKKSV